MTFRLTNANTRFALPIVHPTTGEHVSAEALYNGACDAMGHVVDSHIGDLVFDNFDYDAGEYDERALVAAVATWAAGVYGQLSERS